MLSLLPWLMLRVEPPSNIPFFPWRPGWPSFFFIRIAPWFANKDSQILSASIFEKYCDATCCAVQKVSSQRPPKPHRSPTETSHRSPVLWRNLPSSEAFSTVSFMIPDSTTFTIFPSALILKNKKYFVSPPQRWIRQIHSLPFREMHPGCECSFE